MKNQDIREHCKEKHVFLWQCAEALGISEPTMSRRMRAELPDLEKQKIFRIIDELAEQIDQTTTTN